VLATVAEAAQSARAKRLKGTYIPTKKNGLVVEHFSKLGFTRTGEFPDGATTWNFDLTDYVAPELPSR
jgi:predicted enzyme involved in methoxymalonyl-ACP biosynthesis